MKFLYIAFGFLVLLAASAGLGFWELHQSRTSEAETSALTLPSPVAEEFLDETTIVGNGHPDDPCTVEIPTIALAEMEKIGIHKWVAACEVAVANQGSSNL